MSRRGRLICRHIGKRHILTCRDMSRDMSQTCRDMSQTFDMSAVQQTSHLLTCATKLHGRKYNWNSHPMAPPGTRAVIYLDPDNRTSWGARGLDAWYCGPDFDHYRCCSFYVPETRAYRTTATFDLFPQHCSLPEFFTTSITINTTSVRRPRRLNCRN